MKRSVFSLSLFAVLLFGSLLLAVAPRGGAAGNPWWDAQWPFRVAVTVEAAGYARQDKVAEIPINFTDLLNEAGASSRFLPDSLRVVEVAGSTIVNDAVPFQFDRAPNYNSATNAAGTLVVLLDGSTPAGDERTYHVYFDVVGTDYAPPNFPNRVGLASIVDPYGFDTFRLTTSAGFYYFHKTGGGFASLLDGDGRDWISWNPEPLDAGDSRGIPNLLFPTDGGYFHPGRTGVESVAGRRGPLKVSIRSATTDGGWMTTWDVFPTYARLTVEKVVAGTNYWLLAESTPGGTLDLTDDLVTRSDGTTTTAGEAWTGDIPGEEWVYFTDPALGRSMFAIHHQEDELVDSYRPSSKELMTVFGFGRSGNARFLTEVPKQFSFGLVDETAYVPMAAAVRNAYKPLGIAVGGVETRPFTPTPSPSPTSPPTETPTPTNTPEPTDTSTPTTTPKPTKTPTPTATALGTTATPTATVTVTTEATATLPPAGYRVYLGVVIRP
jgi:cell division septation protein DedD